MAKYTKLKIGGQRLAAAAILLFAAANHVVAASCFGCCDAPRAYCTPECHPTWGYHQTCWRQFPPLQPCANWGDYCPTCQNGDIQQTNGAWNDSSIQGNVIYSDNSLSAESYPMQVPAVPQSMSYPSGAYPQANVNGLPGNYPQFVPNQGTGIPQPTTIVPGNFQPHPMQPMPSNPSPLPVNPTPMNEQSLPAPSQLPPGQTYNYGGRMNVHATSFVNTVPQLAQPVYDTPSPFYGSRPYPTMTEAEQPSWSGRVNGGLTNLRNRLRLPGMASASAPSFGPQATVTQVKPSFWSRVKPW